MKHILLVDDDHMNLVMAKHALVKDYRVTSVTSGKEALHMLEEDTPDSVFCSHGAGHIVPWNEVRAHAHCEVDLSALEPD